MTRIRIVGIALGAASLFGMAQTSGDLSARQMSSTNTTMLDMTFPEFEAAVRKTDVVLLPIGSIEEHGPHLPLSTDSITAVGQFNEVQRYLHARQIETIVGPPLNVGLTSDGGDFKRTGTYFYPGSLTIRAETFVSLYLDVLRSLRDKGLHRAFLYSGHSGGDQQKALARIAEEGSRTIEGLKVYALMPSENVATFGLESGPHLLSLEKFRGFELLTSLLGNGAEAPRTTHADGTETSVMLYYRPDLVRRGYQKLPQGTSSQFLAAAATGDRSQNPGGSGGYPFSKASAAVGKKLLDYRTARIGEAIVQVVAFKGIPEAHADRHSARP
jgi:creatinine amidohydrolase